jgi:aminoglycoside/choline kinase family phosphotransferase
VQAAAPEAARLPALHDHSLIQRWFPSDDLARIVGLWDRREAGLQMLERLPHTLCHLDANRRNLIRRQDQAGAVTTTLIDWAGCGIAAIGKELAWLVWASYFMFEVDPTEIDRLEAATFQQYVAGLRDAEWRGDQREVRIGYALGSAFRNATALGLDMVLDAEQRSSIEQVSGRPLEECLDRWADVNHRALDNLDALGL